MYRRFLDKEITFEEMTIGEFAECINQWKQDLIRMGFEKIEANEYVREVLSYHVNHDVDNEHEKKLVNHYLANEL